MYLILSRVATAAAGKILGVGSWEPIGVSHYRCLCGSQHLPGERLPGEPLPGEPLPGVLTLCPRHSPEVRGEWRGLRRSWRPGRRELQTPAETAWGGG